MSESAVLIQAAAATPYLDSQPLSAPLTCSINTATLVCLLGQRFNVTNAYMQILAGTEDTHSGSVSHADILLNNSPINNCPAIAYIYHNTALLSVLNGVDNVKLPALYHQIASTAEIDKEAHELMAELEYEANHRLLPAFMGTLQKRHLLIVRAIMLKPKMLFIENPFQSLDREQVRIFGQYIAGLVKNKHITVVTSNVNLDFVQNYADQMIYITANHAHVFHDWDAFSYYVKAKTNNELL